MMWTEWTRWTPCQLCLVHQVHFVHVAQPAISLAAIRLPVKSNFCLTGGRAERYSIARAGGIRNTL